MTWWKRVRFFFCSLCFFRALFLPCKHSGTNLQPAPLTIQRSVEFHSRGLKHFLETAVSQMKPLPTETASEEALRLIIREQDPPKEWLHISLDGVSQCALQPKVCALKPRVTSAVNARRHKRHLAKVLCEAETYGAKWQPTETSNYRFKSSILTSAILVFRNTHGALSSILYKWGHTLQDEHHAVLTKTWN